MSINNISEFHEYVGETIEYCQCIENDIRWIYSAMLKGDHRKTFDELERSKSTLGNVLGKLKRLDISEDPYFSEEDYDLLSQITEIRNHWAHKGYVMFVYKQGREWEDAFIKQARRLENDHNRLEKLSKNIEDIRFDVLRKYNRI